VSFPEKFWTLWPPLQWPSLKQKCPSPHPPKPLCSPFSTWHFWPPSKKKRGQRFGGMLGQSSNFFLLQLEHQVIWKLTKAFPKNRIMGTSSAVHLSASVVDTTERGDRGWKKGWNKVTLLITLIKLLDLVVWIIILSCLEWTKNQMCYRVW